MSRHSLVMSAVVLLLITGLALAQPPRGPRAGRSRSGFGGPGGTQATLMAVVRIPEVQKELGLSDKQQKDVTELTAETDRQMRSSMEGIDFQELQEKSQDERQRVMADFLKKIEEGNEKADQKLGKLLDEKQLDRLNQLRLQREGISALSRAEVAKQIGLSDDQIARIRTIQEQGRPQFGAPGGPGGADQDPSNFMARMQKQREKVQADILAVLTDEQRAKWAEMKGKEFKFPQPQFRGFGSGGGRGFGSGGGKAAERTRPPIKPRDQ